MGENQLKAIRKCTGMTQQEFASHLDISLSSVANIENGSREISKAMMKSLRILIQKIYFKKTRVN